MQGPLEHLQALQKWRCAKGRAAAPSGSIQADVTKLQNEVERHAARFGNAAQLWEEFIPTEIHADTRLSGLSGGVLSIVTSSAATSFALDRVLREGAQEQLRRASKGKISRVRVRIGALDSPA